MFKKFISFLNPHRPKRDFHDPKQDFLDFLNGTFDGSYKGAAGQSQTTKMKPVASAPSSPFGVLAESTIEQMAQEIVEKVTALSDARKRALFEGVSNKSGKGFEIFQNRAISHYTARISLSATVSQRDKDFFQEIALGLGLPVPTEENKHASPEDPGIYKGKIIGLAPEMNVSTNSGEKMPGRVNVLIRCSEISGHKGISPSYNSFYFPLREYYNIAQSKKNKEELEIHVNKEKKAYIEGRIIDNYTAAVIAFAKSSREKGNSESENLTKAEDAFARLAGTINPPSVARELTFVNGVRLQDFASLKTATEAMPHHLENKEATRTFARTSAVFVFSHRAANSQIKKCILDFYAAPNAATQQTLLTEIHAQTQNAEQQISRMQERSGYTRGNNASPPTNAVLDTHKQR